MIWIIPALASARMLKYPPFFGVWSNWYITFFTKPYCTQCEKIDSDFNAVANAFEAQTQITFMTIDCSKHSTFCLKHGIFGVPHIGIFNKRKAKQFKLEGNKSIDSITEFIMKSTNLSILPDKIEAQSVSFEEIQTMLKIDMCVAVPFRASEYSLTFQKILHDFSGREDFAPFVTNVTEEAKLASIYGNNGSLPSILVMTYMGWKHVPLNQTYDVIRYAINQICTVGRRDVLRAHVLKLLAGKPPGTLTTIFGNKKFQGASVEFARESLVSPVHLIKSEVQSLRRNALTGDTELELEDISERIVLLRIISELLEFAHQHGSYL